MHLLFFLYGLLAQPDDPARRLWTARVGRCLSSGPVAVWAADESAGLLAFACGEGERRLVVMANGGETPQRVRREGMEPVVPVFATRGAVADVPSLLVTLFEAGGVVYENEVPPRTVVVFRPAEPDDVRPGGLEE